MGDFKRWYNEGRSEVGKNGYFQKEPSDYLSLEAEMHHGIRPERQAGDGLGRMSVDYSRKLGTEQV